MLIGNVSLQHGSKLFSEKFLTARVRRNSSPHTPLSRTLAWDSDKNFSAQSYSTMKVSSEPVYFSISNFIFPFFFINSNSLSNNSFNRFSPRFKMKVLS